MMSTNLMWKPTQSAKGSLPYDLKKAISRKLWDTDGSCGGAAVVSHQDMSYLEGLRDGGVDGAQDLITLISEYGEIELWHEG